MPHPGERARRQARALFGLGILEEPTVDQCLAAVDYAVIMRADGKLPDDGPAYVTYPERPGAYRCLCARVTSLRPTCGCGLSRCTRRGAQRGA